MIKINPYKTYTSNNYKNSKQVPRASNPAFTGVTQQSLPIKTALLKVVEDLSSGKLSAEYPVIIDSPLNKLCNTALKLMELAKGRATLIVTYNNELQKTKGSVMLATGTRDDLIKVMKREDFVDSAVRKIDDTSFKVYYGFSEYQ